MCVKFTLFTAIVSFHTLSMDVFVCGRARLIAIIINGRKGK